MTCRKIRGQLDREGLVRLGKVKDEVNSTRQRLKRANFAQRVGEVVGDMRATWEVLGEAPRGRRGRKTKATCGYFRREGVGVQTGVR